MPLRLQCIFSSPLKEEFSAYFLLPLLNHLLRNRGKLTLIQKFSVMPSPRATQPTTSTERRPRNERFDSDPPFDNNPSLSFLGATGVFKHFNPTSAQYSWRGWNSAHDSSSLHEQSGAADHAHYDETSVNEDEWDEPEGHLPAKRKDDVLSFVWRSRDNRKGRHALVLRRGEKGETQPHGSLKPTNTLPATLHGIKTMLTKFPYWDISWCVAIVYMLGSLVWVVNGFAVLLPHTGIGSSGALQPVTTWTGVLGASTFFLGSYLLFLEATNASRSGCFGWAVECTVKGITPEAEVHPGDCEHHYHAKDKHCHVQEDDEHRNPASNAQEIDGEGYRYGAATIYNQRPPTSRDHLLPKIPYETEHCHTVNWLWWPSWYDLRTHFLREIGFLACAIQLFSGLLFWLSKFVTLPIVKKSLPQPAIDGGNWIPQIIGCLGFITACWLFMLETQYKWYIPAPRILGWHVGFWKLIGCVGFLLSAIFGLLGDHGSQEAEKQSAIASFWGSCTILMGSLVQWYESLDKYPIVDEGTSQYSEWNEKFIKGYEEQHEEDEV